MVYFGDATGLSLVHGSADYRYRRVIGAERMDYVVFRFKVAFVRPQKLEVSGEQLPHIRKRLDSLEARYESIEKKNDFGVVVNAHLMVRGPFPCEIVLRGDYDQPGFVVEMQNVGRFGATRFRLGPDELSFFDNIKYVDVLAATRAGACILGPEHVGRAPPGVDLLVTPKAYRAYALAAQAFYPRAVPEPGVASQDLAGRGLTSGARRLAVRQPRASPRRGSTYVRRSAR